jgi:chromosome segregation ATPase
MKVFAEKSSKARKIGNEPVAAHAAASSPGEDRLAQGFELLFGAHIKEQRQELEREHSALTDQIGVLEGAAAKHADSIEELQDKARATLEREQGEYRRRKAIDDELRQMISELRTLVTTTVAELHDRTARLEGSVLELKTSKLDRSELAGFFATLAQQFDKN